MAKTTKETLNQMTKTIQEMLKKKRMEERLSQAAIAEKIGRSRKWVSDFEKGNGNASFESVMAMANFLGFEMSIVTTEPPADIPGSGMTISALTWELNALKKKHGDLEVVGGDLTDDSMLREVIAINEKDYDVEDATDEADKKPVGVFLLK